MLDTERSVTLRNHLSEIERLNGIIEEFSEIHGIPAKAVCEINVALEELLTNTVSYGYSDTAEHTIELRLSLSGGVLTLILRDDAVAFNPLERPDPDVTKPIEEREIGGLGIYFVRKLMDSVEYARLDGHNILTLKKTIAPAATANETV